MATTPTATRTSTAAQVLPLRRPAERSHREIAVQRVLEARRHVQSRTERFAHLKRVYD